MSPSDELMTCASVAERIEAFTDGDLDEATVRGIRRHLSACPNCAEQAELARTLTTELRALPKLELPDRVMDEVRTTVGLPPEVEIGVTPKRRYRPWLAAAAAFIIAITGTFLIHHQHHSEAQQEALRAAAELRLALACVGGITQRADREIRHEVIDQRLIPMISRSFGLKTTTDTAGVESRARTDIEGSSS